MEHKELKRIVPEARAAVLFAHGIAGTPNHFSRLLPLVAENVSVYNLLLDGHGKGVLDFSRTSMKQWEWDVQQAVLELAQTHEKIIIVAHSMGTLFAIEQAISHQKVCGLFLLAVPIKLFLKPVMLATSMKVYFNKIDPNDPIANAAKQCYGISDDGNPLHYLGWTPRFLELFAKIRETRTMLKKLDTPCVVLQSANDEMVSVDSIPYLMEMTKAEIITLQKSTHFYYAPDDYEIIKQRFLSFNRFIMNSNDL